MYSRVEVAACAKRVNRSVPTIWRWIKAGCRIDNAASLEAFRIQMERKKTNIRKHQEARGLGGQGTSTQRVQAQQKRSEPQGNGELPAIGRKGAAGALSRLEQQEAESYRRLQQALAAGDAVEIEQCQLFWLRATELLRKLDLSIELARRQEETQIPLRVAQDAVTAASEWTRIATTMFLSSEASILMGGFKTVGEFKAYFIERFKGVLDLTLKSSLKTCSALPGWALMRIKEAWNIND